MLKLSGSHVTSFWASLSNQESRPRHVSAAWIAGKRAPEWASLFRIAFAQRRISCRIARNRLFCFNALGSNVHAKARLGCCLLSASCLRSLPPPGPPPVSLGKTSDPELAGQPIALHLRCRLRALPRQRNHIGARRRSPRQKTARASAAGRCTSSAGLGR